jgi:DNA-binding NarL/FixJ family response regulator
MIRVHSCLFVDKKESFMNPISVIIADDHSIVIQGLQSVIERHGKDIVVTGTATNGRDVLELDKADVYVLDISMPGLNGLETAEKLVKRDKNCKVIMLSMHDGRNFVERALEYKVKGYVLKINAADEIVPAIHDVYNGKYYFSPAISHYFVQDYVTGRQPGETFKISGNLTPREKEVLQLIAEGHTSKEIAQRLDLSFNTVLVHQQNLKHKLKISKKADLIRHALKTGMTSL